LGLNSTGKEGKDGIFVSATQGHKRALFSCNIDYTVYV